MTLVVLAAGMTARTFREVRAENLFEEGRQIQRRTPESPLAEVKLRQAYAQDPDHPEILRALANNLIRAEKIKFSRGQLRSMSRERLEEGLDLLGRAGRIYPFEPDVLRAHGETALMFGDMLTQLGERQRAEEMYQAAFQALLASSIELPVPRQSKEAYHAEIIRAAQLIGRQDIAFEYVRHMDKRGYRWILPELRMAEAPMKASFALGVEPRVMRELRWMLASGIDQSRALRRLEAAADSLGQKPAAIHTLEWLDREDRLTPEGHDLLNRLVSKAAEDPVF